VLQGYFLRFLMSEVPLCRQGARSFCSDAQVPLSLHFPTKLLKPPKFTISFEPVHQSRGPLLVGVPVLGFLTHTKSHPPGTLPLAYAEGPRGVLGEWAFAYGRGSPVRDRNSG
jgi:hypothetical protein